jgi:hypothetical protein
MFVRVRGASAGDPLHEFDVSERYVALHPELFTVLDPVPVSVSRPPKFVAAAKKRAARKKPGENKTTAPAGDSLGGDENG